MANEPSLDGKLEPETKDMRQNVALYSIAISLKRIADCMTGDNPGIYDVFHDAAVAARVGWNR